MSKANQVTNVVIAGLGGQGAIRISDILSDAAFRVGYDIKKSEIHGMSKRGGSVSSDVRFGPKVYSPMVPPGEADFLIVLHPTQVDNNLHHLRKGGVLITTDLILKEGQDFKDLDADTSNPLTERNCNVCLLGFLSTYLDIDESAWLPAIYDNLPKKVHEQNAAVFEYGRNLRKD